MDEINKLFQSYASLEKKDLLAIIAKTLKELLPVFESVDKENKGYVCLAMMISSAFGADGKLTEDEIKLLLALEIDAELVKSILSQDDLYVAIDALVDSMDTDQKAVAMSFMIALCALDGKIAPEENAFLKKLLF